MKSINFLIFTLLCCFLPVQQVQPKIHDIRTMAGWYNCFHDDSKHLTPFNGFVWWETKFIEKMFRFGNIITQEKKRGNGGAWTEATDGDATIRLLYELFQDIEGTLHLVQEKTHFAYYLTPELTGKMLHLLQDPVSTIETMSAEENQKICSLESKKIVGILRIIPGATTQEKLDALHANQKYHAQCQNLYTQLFQGLFKMNLESSLVVSVGKSTKREIIKSANKFADLFTNALLESHDLPSIEEQKFIAYTPGYILLSFMYAKADNADQFRAYTAQLPPAVLKENAQEILNTKKFDNAWSCEQFDKVDKQFIQEHYEEICFTQINDQFYKLQTPLLREHRAEVIIQGFSFVSCAEEAIYNFILAILSKVGLYNIETKIFDLDNFEHQMIAWLGEKGHVYNSVTLKNKLNQLRGFLEKFNDPLLMHSQASLQAWAEFVSDRDGIKYSRCIATDGSGKEIEQKQLGSPFIYPVKNQHIGKLDSSREKNRSESWILCELAGYPSMFVNVTNDLLGLDCENFESICKLFDFSIEANTDVTENFTDKFIMDRVLGKVIFNLKTIINKQHLLLRLSTTTGHASFINGYEQEDPNMEFELTGERAEHFSILKYALSNFIEDHQSFHFLMLYSSYDIGNSPYNTNIKTLTNQASWFNYHFWFARNLFLENVHMESLIGLALAEELTFCHKLAHEKFELLISKADHQAGRLIPETVNKRARNNLWLLQLCEAVKEKSEAELYKIVEVLIRTILNISPIDSLAQYDLLINFINYLFEQTLHDDILYFTAEALILFCYINLVAPNLLKVCIEKKLQALFCQPLPENPEQRSNILNKEFEILINATRSFKRSTDSQQCNDSLYQCIECIFERMQFIFEKGTSDEVESGILKLCEVCKYFYNATLWENGLAIEYIKKTFDKKCLPLIQYLEQNSNFFSEKVGQDFFDKHMKKIKKYRNGMKTWYWCTII